MDIFKNAKCYKCGKQNYPLVTLGNCIGTYFICDKCIRQEEDETGTIAVLFYNDGIRFLTKEEHDKLPPIEIGNI